MMIIGMPFLLDWKLSSLQKLQMSKKKILDTSLLPPPYVSYAQHPSSYILESFSQSSVINTPQFALMVDELESMYKQEQEGVLYHNLTHAFDVMTTMDRFINELSLDQTLELDGQDRTWILLAAYAHDNGHEGFDNSFYINQSLQLALQYSYISPLENMHSSNLMRLLHKFQINVSLQKKKMMVGMILSTDNLYHGKKMLTLQELQKQPDFSSHQHIVKNRQAILECLLHAADINSPSKQMELFDKWSQRIHLEFENQKRIESKENYQETSPLQILKQQKGFVKDIVLPFYQQITNIFPQMGRHTVKIGENLERILKKEQEAQRSLSDNFS